MFDKLFKKSSADNDAPTFDLINDESFQAEVYDQPAPNYEQRYDKLTSDQKKFMTDWLDNDIEPANMVSIYFEAHHIGYDDKEYSTTHIYDIIIGKSDINYYAIGQNGKVYLQANSIKELGYELVIKFGSPELIFKYDFDKLSMHLANEMIECINQLNSRGLSDKVHTYSNCHFIDQKWAIAFPFMKTWDDQINGKDDHWSEKLSSNCIVDISSENKLLPLLICHYETSQSEIASYLALNIKTGTVIAQAHTLEGIGRIIFKSLKEPLLIAWR